MRVSISNPDPQHCRLNHRISTERVAQGAEFDIPRWASIVYITSSSWVRRRGYMRDSLYPKLIRNTPATHAGLYTRGPLYPYSTDK